MIRFFCIPSISNDADRQHFVEKNLLKWRLPLENTFAVGMARLPLDVAFAVGELRLPLDRKSSHCIYKYRL